MTARKSDNENVIRERAGYWKDVWENLVDDLSHASSNLRLINPHLLLLDMVDELQTSKFRNKSVKSYFQRQLDSYLRNDSVIAEVMSADFALIRREFGKERYTYLAQLCGEVLKRFESGEYRSVLYQNLMSVMTSNDDELDADVLRVILLSLIIEFLLQGHSLEEVRKFPHNLLADYRWVDDGRHLITDFPHHVEGGDFFNPEDLLAESEVAQDDMQRYHEAIQSEIDDLSIRDRLLRLDHYFDTALQKNIFIYRVRGLKGDSEVTIGDVTFYNPEHRQYILKRDRGYSWDETFGADEEFVFMNAAIEISYLDFAVGNQLAKEKIEEALDVLSCYLRSKVAPEIDTSRSVVIDKLGKVVAGHSSVPDTVDWRKWTGGLSVNKDFFDRVFSEDLQDGLNTILKKPSAQHNNVEHTITRCLHWLRKGNTAHKLEDSLLNYWVAVEKLLPAQNSGIFQFVPEKHEMSNLNLAREVIATNEALNYIYSRGWDLFHEVRSLTKPNIYVPGVGPRAQLQLPNELIGTAGLMPSGDMLHLEPFIKSLTHIKGYVNERLLKEKITKVHDFYDNPQTMATELENTFEQVRDDVTLLYWYRNKIVHDAHFDDTILPFYVPRARNYSGLLLRSVIRSYCETGKATVDEVLLIQFSKFHRMRERLSNGEKINVFELDI